MRKLLLTILIVGCSAAQIAFPALSAAGTPQSSSGSDDVPPLRTPSSKVGLVRGVVKQVDPIHDQLLIRPFGGGEIKIAFDTRTQLLPGKTQVQWSSIPVGSVVSVDTVVNGGKLFAVSVEKSTSSTAELNGQIVRYDAAKSELILRDRISPENVILKVTSNTAVINHGQPASAQMLAPGMLVRVSFSAAEDAANKVEIVAARGTSFTFQGRIIGVDMRSRVVSLSNDTDESLRELDFSSLDASSTRLLREGAEVNIQAEFDGNRYNIRSVMPIGQNQ